MEDINEGCCPQFNPVPWDEKTHVWYDKRFIAAAFPQFMYIPLPGAMSGMMKKQMKLIKAAEALPHTDEYIWLNRNISPWKSMNYFHVTTEVPGAVNTKISGMFITKVFDGPYNYVPQWTKEMDFYLNASGYTAEKYFVYYTTCPKCAKKYDHNYIVLFAMI